MIPSSSTVGKRPQSAALIGTNGGRNGRNPRIGQRAIPTSAAGTTVKNEGNWQDGNLMQADEFSPERRMKIVENGGSRIGRQKSSDWIEIVQQPIQSGSSGFNNHFK
jgi:hypothetical protein